MRETIGLGKSIMNKIDGVFHFDVAYAHCDIPCGIYDPHAAQLAAHTVIRMDLLIDELNSSGNMDVEARNKMIRCVRVKEKHAAKCEEEITTLWADYFKPDHFKENPKLHQLIWDTLQTASKARQSTNVKDGEALLANVEEVAEIFWKTKKIKTKKEKSLYPTERDFVYPVV
jgi:nickel superoxide dismutase